MGLKYSAYSYRITYTDRSYVMGTVLAPTRWYARYWAKEDQRWKPGLAPTFKKISIQLLRYDAKGATYAYRRPRNKTYPSFWLPK